MLLAFGTMVSAGVIAQTGDVTPPPAIAAKIRTLPKDQQDFLTSKDVKKFTGSHTKLWDRIGTMSAAEIGTFVQTLMMVSEEEKFKAGRDLPSIPLNTESKSFNGWKTLRPGNLLDPGREPGPFSLNRYVAPGAPRIATFFGLPVAMTPEDLKAGKVDIAFVGAPLDMGGGYRGAKEGPQAIRNVWNKGGGMGWDVYTHMNPGEELRMVDYGDIAVDNMSTERSMEHVRQMVGDIARAGTIPFIVGGDHSLAYSDIAAMADVHGKGKVSVIHFDSHIDASSGAPHMITHGQPVYRLIKEGHVKGKDYIEVGIRAQYPPELYQWIREQGFRYHTMAAVERFGWDKVLDRVLKDAKENGNKTFISFDVDVLDPNFMVGTGTPVSAGLTMREVLPLIRRLCAETDLVGFEIVEVAPLLDPTYQTALNSAAILRACAVGITLKRKGIKTTNYISPVTSDDGFYGKE